MALIDLLARVKNATGPDRQLDGLIGWHLDGWNTFICPNPTDVHYMIVNNGLAVPFYTASADASMALVGRALPQWVVQLNSGDPTRLNHRQPWAKVAPYDTNDAGWKVGAKDARCATVPLAIVSATLAAIIAGVAS